jgi:hypothetical protein
MPDATVTLRTRADLAGVRQLDAAYQALSRDEQRLIRDNIALAQSFAALQRAQGNAASGAATLRSTLAGLSAAPARSVLQLNTQIAGLDNAAARSSGSVQSLGTAFGGLTQAAGVFGVGAGVQQIISFGVESAKAALTLRETQNSLRAVAGSTERYNDILAIARQQQNTFGGSLNDNIEGLLGLSITARQSGADLEQLIDISQRLNVLSPEQGLQGARIALSEAFSGNITSLSRRFEIPRSALKDLKDESLSTEQRLAALDAFLSNVGVTSEAVAGKVDASARAFRGLGAEAEEARLRVGGFIADTSAPIAERVTTGLDRAGQGITGLSEAFANLRGELIGQTEFYKAYAQAIAQGLGPEEANRIALEAKTRAFADSVGWTAQARDATIGYGGAVLQYTSLIVGVEEQRAESLRAIQDGQAGVTSGAAELAQGLADQAAENIKASDEAERLKNLQTDLADISGQVRDGLITQAEGAQAIIDKYSLASDAARELISLQAQVSGATLTPAGQAKRRGQEGGLLDRTGTERTNTPIDVAQQQAKLLQDVADRADQAAAAAAAQAKRDAEQAAAEAKRLADAKFNHELSLAKTTADKIAVYQKRLNATTDEAERLNIQSTINGLRSSGAGRSKANPQARGLGALDRDTIALAGDERAQLAAVNRQLEAGNLTTHQRNQLLIKQQDLEEKIAEQIERQSEAKVDARLASVRDQQERIKEERELGAAQRILDRPEQFSAEQRQLAALRVEEITLERQKRELDIAEKAKEGGIGIPAPVVAGTGGAPAPAGATTSAGGRAPSGQTAGVFLDSKQVGFILLPDLLAALSSGRMQVTAAGG